MKVMIDLTAVSAYDGCAPHMRSSAETVEKTNWSGKAHSDELSEGHNTEYET
jgi:hypothetical protein